MSERRMDAYYYGFDETGCDPVDDVLSAVAIAGKCFHHTDEWNDKMEWADNKSCADLIQEAAQKAAEAFNTRTPDIDALTAQNEKLREALRLASDGFEMAAGMVRTKRDKKAMEYRKYECQATLAETKERADE